MRLLLCVALLVVAGCGRQAAKQDTPVTLDEVPDVVMKAAQEAAKESFPDVKFHTATIKPNGVYEITGKTKSGKIHDVEVKADGEVVEVE